MRKELLLFEGGGRLCHQVLLTTKCEQYYQIK